MKVWMRKLTTRDILGNVTVDHFSEETTLLNDSDQIELVGVTPEGAPDENYVIYYKRNLISAKVVNYQIEVPDEGAATADDKIKHAVATSNQGFELL
jgi:hypothetical protein